MKTQPRYIAKFSDKRWFTYDTKEGKAVISCADKAEAERYAKGYNLDLTDREIVEEYAKVP